MSGSRPFRTVSDRICAKAGFKPKIGFESDSPIAVKNIIGAEAGIGFWPEFSWGEFNSDFVSLIPIADQGCEREIFVGLYDNSSNSIYAEKFYEYLVNFLNDKKELKN